VERKKKSYFFPSIKQVFVPNQQVQAAKSKQD
jgi:hypothetical protein